MTSTPAIKGEEKLKCGNLELLRVTIFNGEPPFYRKDLNKEVNKVLKEYKDREFIKMWFMNDEVFILIGGE